MVRPALLVLTLLLCACGAAKPSGPPQPPADADLDMRPNDFDCIMNWSSVRRFRITNKLGFLDATLAVANAPEGGTYPTGTIIQLVPNEAMVKRKKGWNAATHDWEFFALSPNSDGTTEIQERGGAEVQNHFGGGSCFNCHAAAAEKYDLVCETSHGCVALPFGTDVIHELQAADQRCQ